MEKFCEGIKGNNGLCDNMADAKSPRNDIKDMNNEIEKIQQHKDNKLVIKQKEKRIATMLTTFLLSTKKNKPNHPHHQLI